MMVGGNGWKDAERFERVQYRPPEILQRAPERFVLARDFVCPPICADPMWSMSIKAPAGYPVDGASIPPEVWSLLGIHPIHSALVASIRHDLFYGRDFDEIPEHWKNRELVDSVFAFDLEQTQHSDFDRVAMHSAVRIGGGEIWARITRQIREGRRQVWTREELRYHLAACRKQRWMSA